MKQTSALKSADFILKVWVESKGGEFGSLQVKEGKSLKQSFFSITDPRVRERMVDYLSSAPKNSDLYFCPLASTKSARTKDAFERGSILWADLDEADPTQDPKPNIVWETSPGRFQALWFLDQVLPLDRLESLNKRLTYKLGADKGGWDAGQILRIPGTTNHKPQYDSPVVTLRRRIAQRYSVMDLEKAVGGPPEPQQRTEPVGTLPPPLRLSARLLEQWTHWEDIPVGERSEKPHAWAWGLLEKGMDPAWVVKVVGDHPLSREKWGKRAEAEIERSVIKWQEQKPVKARPEDWVPPTIWTAQEFLTAPQEIKWMAKDMWLEETVGMISGPPKAFKTWIALDLAISVASCSPLLGMPDFHVHPSGNKAVLIVQEEDPRQVIARRLSKILSAKGFDAGGFRKSRATVKGREVSLETVDPIPLYVVNSSGFNLQDENYILWLEEAIKDLKLRLVILDPLIVMLGDTNEFKGGEVARLLRPIKLFREAYACSFCIVHHIIKRSSSDRRPGEELYGSFAFHAWLESALHVRPLKEREMDVWLASETDSQATRVKVKREFKAAGSGAVLDINFGNLSEAYNPIVTVGEGFQVADQEIAKLVEMLLEEGPLHLGDLRERTKISRRRLDRLIKLAETRGRITWDRPSDSPKSWKIRAIEGA